MVSVDIKTLYDASIPRYSKMFTVLLTHGSSFPRFNQGPKEFLALVQLRGNTSDAQRAVDLAKNRIQDKIRKTVDSAMSAGPLLPDATKLAEIVGKMPISTSVVSLILSAIKQETVVIPEQDFSNGLSAEILDTIFEKYSRQPDGLKDNEVITMMVELQLASPQLQVSVCPLCHNFELILSSLPNRDAVCSKCNKENVTARVYLLTEEFNSHKAKNKDLPLYIEYYLQRKYGLQAQAFRQLDGKGEMDVWVQETLTGIECKLQLIPITQEVDIDWLVGELRKQLKRYVDGGAKRLLVVSNLNAKDALTLEKKLGEALTNDDVHYDHLKILDKSIESLWQALDEEAKLKT